MLGTSTPRGGNAIHGALARAQRLPQVGPASIRCGGPWDSNWADWDNEGHNNWEDWAPEPPPGGKD